MTTVSMFWLLYSSCVICHVFKACIHGSFIHLKTFTVTFILRDPKMSTWWKHRWKHQSLSLWCRRPHENTSGVSMVSLWQWVHVFIPGDCFGDSKVAATGYSSRGECSTLAQREREREREGERERKWESARVRKYRKKMNFWKPLVFPISCNGKQIHGLKTQRSKRKE